MLSLSGKVAIISGASSGIGRASALLFASEGARVVVGARRHAELALLVDAIIDAGGEAAAVTGDARTEAYAAALVECAMQRFGRLDISFNNVGTLGATGPSAAIELAAWTATVETNLTSAFLGAKHQIPRMIEAGGGSVIFTSSYVGYALGFPQVAAYAASKAGLIGLTQALASEFSAQNIRINALVPGSVDTPAFRAEFGSDEQQGFIAGLHALKRVATAEEMARSALYLASDASAFTTGSALVADGGARITRT